MRLPPFPNPSSASRLPSVGRTRPAARLAALAAVALLAACSPGERNDPRALRDAAEAALSRGDRPAALVSLRAALQSQPGDTDARFILGRTLLEMGEPAGATTELERAVEGGFPKPTVAPFLVRALALSGRAREAVDRFGNERPADNHAAAELSLALAVAWDLLGEPARLREALDRTLSLRPQDAEARTLQARLLAAEGQPDAAWRLLEQVLSEVPQQASAWQTRGLLQRTWKQDRAGALESQNRALALDPSMVSAHDEILTLHADRGDLPALQEQLQALERVQPGHPVALFFRAQADAMAGRWAAARETLQALLKRGPDVPRFVQAAARVDQHFGDVAQAQARLEVLLSKRPLDVDSRGLLARLQLASGDATTALRTLEPLLARKPPPLEAVLTAVDAEAARGRASEALRWFQQAATLAPDDRRVQVLQALRRGQSSAEAEHREGVKALEALSVASAATDADRARVQVHVQRRQWAAALAAVDDIERKRPGRGEAPLLQAEVHLRAGDRNAARQSLETAAAREPSEWAPVAGLVAMDLAVPDGAAARGRLDAFQQRNPSSAEAALLRARIGLQLDESPIEVAQGLQRFVKAQPQDVVVRSALIDTLLSAGQNEAALQAAREGLAAAPNHPGLVHVAGRAHLLNNQAAEALRLFGQIDALVPASPLGPLGRAEAAWRARDAATATSELRLALDRAPQHPEVRRLEHAVALGSGRLDQALAAARALQAAAPADALGFALEGEAHLQARRWAEAASAFERALQRARSSRHAIQRHLALLNAGRNDEAQRFAQDWLARWPEEVALRMHLGDVAGALGRWADAEAQYREVTKRRPQAAVAFNNLAWALLQQRKPEALTAAEQADRLAPKTPAFMDTLAGALAGAGQLPRALALQKEAVGLPGATATHRLHLAEFAKQAGDMALARQTAEALDPTSLTADEVSRRARLLGGA